jgi:hypothetical protein
MKPITLLLLLCLFPIVCPAEKPRHSLALGVETSFGDVLSYPATGFQFSLKPYLNWDVAGSGFVLGIAFGLPIAPWGGPTQLELIEEYGLTLNEKAGLELAFGNQNSLTFGSPVLPGGYLYLLLGLKGWGLGAEITYLDAGAFGFGKLSLVPGYTFEFGAFHLGLKVKFNMSLAGSPATLGLEPLISFDRTF